MATSARPKKRRDLFKDLTLFGETWKHFRKGILPLYLLKELSWLLSDSADFRAKNGIDYQFHCGAASAPCFILASVVEHQPRKLDKRDSLELAYLLQIDMERLMRMTMLPKLGENDTLRREAILSTLERLGQVYHHCLRRWKKAAARELFWKCLDVVLEESRVVERFLVEEARIQALLKAKLAENERIQAGA
ncbi:MAG TPA: hypothetical protein VH540_05460 [Ktedonobacterales bacterium]|jgi:hypothetical protein